MGSRIGGAIGYTYDPNGNLLTRSSGGITATYAYDELDEVLSKSYSDGTPPVSYSYNAGWLTSVSSGTGPSGTTSYQYTAFDGLGRVTAATETIAATQSTPSASYSFGNIQYNLAGGTTSMTMPSGRVVTTTYDNLGRPASVSGQLGAGPTVPYVSSVTYAPHGALAQMALNNGLTEQTCFNSRLQPVVIRQRRNGAADCSSGAAADGSDVGYLSYGFSASANNGNPLSQTIQYGASGSYGSSSFQQTYTYADPVTGTPLNRLMSVTETGPSGSSWNQQFAYDAVGNRWLASGARMDPSTPMGNGYDGNNHLSGNGYGDGRGNVTQIGGYGYQYDAENRMVSETLSNGGTVVGTTAYGYDGEGRRVLKQSGSATTHYVYDVEGELVAEYAVAGTGPSSPCGTCYLMADHLGSTRMQTDGSGAQQQLSDYAPFGEDLARYNNRDARWGGMGNGIYFTGQERDQETGLDYFGARYLSGAQGRWTSPDAPLADQWEKDPQSWNLYGYVRNNPLRFTDLMGRDCVTLDNGTVGDNGQGTMCKAVTDADKQKEPDVTVTAQGGNAMVAFGLNFLFALDNAANAWFSPLTKAMGVTPSYMRDTPTSNDSAGKLAAGAEFIGEMALGPGEERAALKLIHSPETLSKTILEGLRKKSTQELVESLKPGMEEALRVKPDGRVMNGNHRIAVLLERGVNVNALPREIVR